MKMKTRIESGFDIKSVLKSFLGSSLIVSSLIIGVRESNEFIEVVTILLAFLGVLIMLDVLIPFNRPVPFFTCVVLFIAGVVASLISNSMGQIDKYFSFILFLTIVVYLEKYVRKYVF